MLIPVVENENSICNNNTTQQRMHTPTFSQSNKDQSISPMYLPFLYAAAGSTFTVGSSDDQATSKDHLHPSLPPLKMLIYSFNLLTISLPLPLLVLKMLIYSFNLLTISLPLPLLVNSNCNLSIITYPIVTSHFQISNNFTSEPYLSRCCLKLLYTTHPIVTSHF